MAAPLSSKKHRKLSFFRNTQLTPGCETHLFGPVFEHLQKKSELETGVLSVSPGPQHQETRLLLRCIFHTSATQIQVNTVAHVPSLVSLLQAKTGISIEDYRGQDVQLVALLKDFQKYIKQEADKWDTWAENYRLNTQYVTGQTLDAFKNFPFDEIVAYSLRQQTRLESALNDRLQVRLCGHTHGLKIPPLVRNSCVPMKSTTC